MIETTCSMIGFHFLPKGQRNYIREALKDQALQAIADGYTRFICGFSNAVDIMFAELMVELKKQHPNLFLEAALPYASRASLDYIGDLLTQCNGVTVISTEYIPGCTLTRNHFMVAQSQRIIVVYDGLDRGATLFALYKAARLQRDIRLIDIYPQSPSPTNT